VFRSLRIQLGAIVFCFVLLVAGSVAITYLIVQTQASGATLRALPLIQLVLLVAALLLLTWGYFFTRRRFTRPLAALNRAAHRIAEGHLDESVRVEGDDELTDLARAFETMRADVAASRDELESRVAQRTRELASAFELSQEIVSQLDLRHLLQSVTDHARALTRAEAASLCLLDEGNTALVLSSTSGAKVPPPDMRQPVWLVPANQGLVSDQMVAVESACANCGFLHSHEPGHCVAAPLRVADRTLGALCIVRSDSPSFDADETRALTLLANSAAIAIANARLVESERRQAEQAARLAERERLAADLHDHLAQTLGFLNLEIDQVRAALAADGPKDAQAELDRMKTAVGEAYRQVRAALVGLREPLPAGDDLIDKLNACLADFRETSGLPAELFVSDPSALALPRLAQAQAYLIVREALVNVRRHAQAQQASVRIDCIDGQARFTVEDNGRGFDVSSVEGDHHLGLTIMQARAERSGGYLTVDSTPGAGTKIAAYFPLDVAAPDGSGHRGPA